MRALETAVFVLAATVTLPADATLAVTIHVPSEQPTIWQGLAVAAPGDTVLVAAGIYAETDSLVIESGETLLSVAGPAGTVIRPVGSHYRMLTLSEEGPSHVLTTIEGFTFDGSDLPFSGAFRASHGTGSGKDVVIRNCAFRNIPRSAISAVGIDLDVSESGFVDCQSGLGLSRGELMVQDCSFRRCTLVTLSIFDGQIADCEFLENTARAGAPVRLYGGTISGCRFAGNSSPGDGGAVEAHAGSEISGCLFEGNSAGYLGGAIWAPWHPDPGPPIEILDNVFLLNESTYEGGAIAARHQVEVRGNTFYRNEQASTRWGGTAIIFYEDANPSVLKNNIFARSQPTIHAIFSSSGVFVDSACNIFWDFSGGIGDGYSPTSDDLVGADPLFCDEQGFDFTLAENSPGLPAVSPQCGPIGALGQGCQAVSVKPVSWGALKARYRR